MPSHALMEGLLDKLRFQALAQRHGFLIARAVRLCVGTQDESIWDLRYPCVLKPASKNFEYDKRFGEGIPGRVRRRGLAFVVRHAQCR